MRFRIHLITVYPCRRPAEISRCSALCVVQELGVPSRAVMKYISILRYKQTRVETVRPVDHTQEV